MRVNIPWCRRHTWMIIATTKFYTRDWSNLLITMVSSFLWVWQNLNPRFKLSTSTDHNTTQAQLLTPETFCSNMYEYIRTYTLFNITISVKSHKNINTYSYLYYRVTLISLFATNRNPTSRIIMIDEYVGNLKKSKYVKHFVCKVLSETLLQIFKHNFNEKFFLRIRNIYKPKWQQLRDLRLRQLFLLTSL